MEVAMYSNKTRELKQIETLPVDPHFIGKSCPSIRLVLLPKIAVRRKPSSMAHGIESALRVGPDGFAVPLFLSISLNHRLVLCHRLKSGIYFGTRTKRLFVGFNG